MEHEAKAEHRLQPPPEGRLSAQGDQKEIAHYHRGQHQGQVHQGIENKRAPAAPGQARSHEQSEGEEEAKTEAKEEPAEETQPEEKEEPASDAKEEPKEEKTAFDEYDALPPPPPEGEE